MSTDTEAILNALDDHRREVRSDMSELRSATTEMATAVANLTTTVARVEERHARHDDGIRNVRRVLDDHETRIRSVEVDSNSRWSRVSGGWLVLTVLGGLVIGLVTISTKLS